MSILTHALYPSNADYHANPRLSWTGLKIFMQSPMAFAHLQENPRKKTDAMKFGSLVHCLALTPELVDEEFRVRQSMPLRSKTDKMAFIDHLIQIDCAHAGEEETLLSCKADELRALEDNAPFDWIDEYTMERGKRVTEAILPHLPDSGNAHNREAAFCATIEGVDVQCKVDYVAMPDRVYDIKTTGDLERWQFDMERGLYLMGDVFYRMVIEEHTSFLIPPIRYIGVQTTAPHDVIIRHYPESYFDPAREKICGALREYRKCKDTGVWPGIDRGNQEPQELSVVPWIESSLCGSIDIEDLFGSGKDAA